MLTISIVFSTPAFTKRRKISHIVASSFVFSHSQKAPDAVSEQQLLLGNEISAQWAIVTYHKCPATDIYQWFSTDQLGYFPSNSPAVHSLRLMPPLSGRQNSFLWFSSTIKYMLCPKRMKVASTPFASPNAQATLLWRLHQPLMWRLHQARISVPEYHMFRSDMKIQSKTLFWWLQKGLTKLWSKNPDCLWIKLDKTVLGLETDLYLCNTYIVPDNSVWTLMRSRKLC